MNTNLQNRDPYRMINPYDEEFNNCRASIKKKIFVTIFACMLLCFGVIASLFIYDAIRDPEFSAYSDEQILICGLDDKNFNITPKELCKLKCEQITLSATGSGEFGESKAGVVSAYGPTLRTFLATFGTSPEDFRRIKFSCKDDYDVIVRGETLSYDIILSFASGKKALVERQQPLRVIILDETSGKWAYGITRIDFYK